MATQLQVVSLKATVNGTQTGDTGGVYVDIDADLGTGETSGYQGFSLVLPLDGLSAGDLVGVDWGTGGAASNSFVAVGVSLELRPA